MKQITLNDLPPEVAAGLRANYEDEPLPELWSDGEYLALVHDFTGTSPWDQLSVQRFDGRPIQEWDTLQRIKNEVYGPHFEAVELYPDVDRLVDMGNTRHLWVQNNEDLFPIGFRPLVPFVTNR
jgi:hypothetical protein